MILDSIENLNKTFSLLSAFLESADEQCQINTITRGNPEPYDQFLPYIKFIKANGEKISIYFSKVRALQSKEINSY